MYAVIKTGGKQFRVVAGEKIKVEQIAADVGQEVVIDQVLAVGNGSDLVVGAPLVSGATVTATLLSHGLFDKVHIFKMRRRKHYQKRQGHRQSYTELFIAAIADGKGGVSKAEAAPVVATPKALASSVATKGGKDNLEIIEGIGPKIAKVLVDGGISTFALLAAAKADDVTAMLKASGGRFSLANPASWAEQAALLRDGKMAEFKALTDALVGGVKK
ncbi:MAG: ribosomal protein [Pseudomonadota bacterium]|jgi:large subunit ribosomal protein L21